MSGAGRPSEPRGPDERSLDERRCSFFEPWCSFVATDLSWEIYIGWDMVTVPPVVGVVWPVVAGGVGLAAATFLLYRGYAVRAVDGRSAVDEEATGDGELAADGRAAHHLLWAQYTVVPFAAVAGAALFVLAAEAYLRAATAVAAGGGRGPTVAAAVGLWGATVLASVLAGVRGYAPLARSEGDGPSLRAAARTVAAVAAAAAALGAVVVLVVVAPLAAAAVVAVGRPAAAAVGPLVVGAVERTRSLPAPWDERVPDVAERMGVDLRAARVVADDEARVSLAGLVPGYRVLFVTDRALATLDDETLGALVARELTGPGRRATVQRVAVETLPVVLWLASFRTLAAGQALLVGGLLVAPYAVVLGLVGHRVEYAADDAAAAAVGRETVVAAVERAAAVNDVRRRRDPVFDLLAGRPAPQQRVERLRGGNSEGPDALVEPDGTASDGADGS